MIAATIQTPVSAKPKADEAAAMLKGLRNGELGSPGEKLLLMYPADQAARTAAANDSALVTKKLFWWKKKTCY